MNQIISLETSQVIPGLLLYCRDNTPSTKIVTQLLNGSYTIQQTGVSPTTLSVKFVCARSSRVALEACNNTGVALEITFGSQVYQGLISSDQITSEPYLGYGDAEESVTFEMLVSP